MATEKHYYIGPEKLREKYLGPANFPRVQLLVKAIQHSSGAQIDATLKKNNIIQFIITGGGNKVNKALGDVEYEFEKSGAIGKPREGRSDKVFLKEDDHNRLQAEIKEDAKNLILLTEDALRKFDILTGASELRQFACGPCNRPWWTYVPRTKPVSSCRICYVRYNALPRHEEFGLGRYICLPCDNTFFARCEATEKHICFGCQKLTGPPYINPRFKPLPFTVPGTPPPRVHKVLNESTVHDSTGSTIATFLTEDLGQNIYVPVQSGHAWAVQDYTKPFEDDPQTALPELQFKPATEDEDEFEVSSTIGEVSDLETAVDFQELLSRHTDKDPALEEGVSEIVSRKRLKGSDSEDSDEDSDSDKMSVTSVVSSIDESEPDSGIGTWSKAGSGSSVSGATSGSSSAKPSVGSSICDFSQVSDYPGVAFSKQKSKATITKEGGIIKGEGITLSVPPGAVSEGDEVTILLQACIGGPFCLPPKPGDLNFISPVYLIQPPFAFRKNVTLSINTFVKFYQNYDNKSFCFVTSPTQKTFNEDFEPQWVFRKFGSPDFNEEHDGRIRGSINLKHFCFGGFAGSVPRKKLSYCYCLYTPHLFCPPVTLALFSVTIHHEVYMENLERYIKAHIGNQTLVPQSRIITFTADGVVSFELPVSTASSQGYSLNSNIVPCEITQEDVDYPLKHRRSAIKDITLYPPKIELRIRDKKSQPKVLRNDLNFQFKVQGIKQNISLDISLTHSPSLGGDRAISSPTARSHGDSSAVSTPRSSIASAGDQSNSASSTASTPRSSITASGGNSSPECITRITSTSSSARSRTSKSSTASTDRSPVARNGTFSEIVRSSSHTSESESVLSSGYGSQESHEATIGSTSLLDSKPNIAKLLNDLVDIAWEWEAIAINLGLEVREIRGIEADITCKREESKLRKVLMKWSEKPLAKPFTWRTIIEVLKEPSLDQHHLADRIADRLSA